MTDKTNNEQRVGVPRGMEQYLGGSGGGNEANRLPPTPTPHIPGAEIADAKLDEGPALRAAYVEALRMPHGAFRHSQNGQQLLALLREAVALAWGVSSKAAQNECEALAARIVPEGWKAVPEDLLTHLGDWQTACQIARQHSPAPTPDQDDASYWDHQLRTIAKIRAVLAAGVDVPAARDAEAAFKFWNDIQQLTAKHGCLGGDDILQWLDARLAALAASPAANVPPQVNEAVAWELRYRPLGKGGLGHGDWSAWQPTDKEQFDYFQQYGRIHGQGSGLPTEVRALYTAPSDQSRVERLETALRGVIAVADRKTIEFDRAHAVLEEKQ